MKQIILIIIPLICLSCSSGFKEPGESCGTSILNNLLEDYHVCYANHYGRKTKDSLEINMCFFLHDSICYVTLSGSKYTGHPWDLNFYCSDDGFVRQDMLGYTRYGIDGLGVYNSIKGDNSYLYSSFLHGLNLDLQVAKDMLKRRDLCFDGGELFYFYCVYQIDSCCNFCLVDSGNYYQLQFDQFVYEGWEGNAN